MRQRQSKSKRNKIHIKFDHDDRKEYLLGFHKRKLLRKQKAKEEKEEMEKREKQETKRKRMEFIKNIINSNSGIFDSDDELEADETLTKQVSQSVTDYGNCTVEIAELDLQKNTNKSKKKVAPKKTRTTTSSSMAQNLSFPKLPGNFSDRTIKTSIWKLANKASEKHTKSKKKNHKKKGKKRGPKR